MLIIVALQRNFEKMRRATDARIVSSHQALAGQRHFFVGTRDDCRQVISQVVFDLALILRGGRHDVGRVRPGRLRRSA